MGLGPIGRGIAARAARESAIELVGAVDSDPALEGEDLGIGIPVVPSLDALPAGIGADVLLHSTGSFLTETAGQLEAAIDRGWHVVSTCEELAYPYYRHPELAAGLDERARAGGVALLGSGVNPGFVMDKFIVTLMAACERVDSLRVVRELDAATRRGPFQKKIGAGMSADEFEKISAGGRLGHIGLAESAHMLADAMGVARERELQRVLRPVLAEREIVTDHVRVGPGQVAGVHEELEVVAAGETPVRMELDMFVGAPNPRDAVRVRGSQSLDVEIGAGLAGDEGTVAVVISCVPLVASLAPGLRTMLDVPLAPPTAPHVR
jgi:4-hydroxy-tetrahydrodipicolinate reductase